MKRSFYGVCLVMALAFPLAVHAESDHVGHELSGFFMDVGAEHAHLESGYRRGTEDTAWVAVDNMLLSTSGTTAVVGYRDMLGPVMLGVSMRYAGTSTQSGFRWRTEPGFDFRQEQVTLSRGSARSVDLALGYPISSVLVYVSAGQERLPFRYWINNESVVSLQRAGSSSSRHLRLGLGMVLPLSDHFQARIELAQSKPRDFQDEPGLFSWRRFTMNQQYSGQLTLGWRF